MRILVLEGGSSNEREISLRSSKTIKESLYRLGHEVVAYDPINGLDEIKKYQGRVDIVFPILHGGEGENGVIQRLLEDQNFKYLGSNSQTCETCFDKTKFKKALQKTNLLFPVGEIVNQDNFKNSKLIGNPFVLKPIDGGSSIDLFIVRDPDNIPSKIYDSFNKYQTMLLEELVEGIEITVGILGSKSLPVVEIIPPQNEEFNFDNKYNGKTFELCPPQNLSDDLQVDAQSMAKLICDELNIRHLSRTDMIITPDEKIYVLETNMLPGLTDQSLFPKSAQVSGLSMDELVKEFIRLVIDENG